MSWAKSWLRRVALLLLVSLLAFAVLTARAVSQGEAEMNLSDQAFDHGDIREAAHHARRAAMHYAPGAPHVRAAYERLEAVAHGAEASGDLDNAMFAWRAIRSAALETGHVRAVVPEERERANRALARLQALQSMPTSRREALRQKKVAERDLSSVGGARAGWILLLALGLGGMLAALGWFTVRGIQPDGSIHRATARYCGLLALLGTACWAWAVVTA